MDSRLNGQPNFEPMCSLCRFPFVMPERSELGLLSLLENWVVGLGQLKAKVV